jgi:hypothetical protein
LLYNMSEYCIQPVHIIPCSSLDMKGNNGTYRIPQYCCPNRHRTSPVFQCCNQAFWIIGFLGCSPNINFSWCMEQREWRFTWPYHARISSCLMSRFYGLHTIVYTSEHYFA